MSEQRREILSAVRDLAEGRVRDLARELASTLGGALQRELRALVAGESGREMTAPARMILEADGRSMVVDEAAFREWKAALRSRLMDEEFKS